MLNLGTFKDPHMITNKTSINKRRLSKARMYLQYVQCNTSSLSVYTEST
jgi:hypothetical protein